MAVTAMLCGASLAASPQEAERLGKDLTPVGAEKAGNKDGSIPAWPGPGPRLESRSESCCRMEEQG
jgi:hypothetical protein